MTERHLEPALFHVPTWQFVSVWLLCLAKWPPIAIETQLCDSEHIHVIYPIAVETED